MNTMSNWKPWLLPRNSVETTVASPPSNADDCDVNVVEMDDNKIFFYSEVDRMHNLELNRSLVSLANKLEYQQNALGVKDAKIELHINSYGGSVFDGFSSVDYILNSKIPVTSIINGCAASAATIMSVVAPERKMHKHSYMLIHQLSSGMWGKYQEMKDEMDNCDRLMEAIKRIYEEHTKVPKKEMDKILKHDLWWDAETCLKYGLVDEII